MFGGSSAAAPSPPPPPPNAPIIADASTQSAVAAQMQAARLAAGSQGFADTVLTGAQGASAAATAKPLLGL